MRSWFFLGFLSLGVCSLGGLDVTARGGMIASLKSTGVNPAGQALATGTDLHYSLLRIDYVGPWSSATYDPLNPPAPRTIKAPAVFTPPLAAQVVSPSFSWVANSPTSTWISQVSTGSSGAYGGHGRYVYQTTFDLMGHDLGSVQIAGNWAADDVGWMYLNLDDPTVPQFSRLVASCSKFWALTPFSIQGTNGLFRPGLNTLSFFTWDSGAGITGLRVDVTKAQSGVVPEPGFGTLLLIAAGCAAVRWEARRLTSREV